MDTCSFIWLITDDKALSRSARETFTNSGNDVFLSSVSVWEIVVKNGLGRLPLPSAAEVFIALQRERHGIESLGLDEESCLHLLRLPPAHRDPFDRMLVCQAIVHGMSILTPDPLIKQYPVRCTW